MLRKLAGGFFFTLLLLTWVSWELNYLRTPQVVCVSPSSGQLANQDGTLQSYPYILPVEALNRGGNDCTVYLVEETSSFFSPLVARRVSITVQAQTENKAAISGLASSDVQVVLYANRSLTGETVPVTLWEGETG